MTTNSPFSGKISLEPSGIDRLLDTLPSGAASQIARTREGDRGDVSAARGGAGALQATRQPASPIAPPSFRSRFSRRIAQRLNPAAPRIGSGANGRLDRS